MERVDTPTANLHPNFISSWIIKPTALCDDLIDYFEFNKTRQRKGVTGSGLNTDKKDSLDIVIRPKEIILPGNEIFKNYFEKLFECHKDYIAQWPFINNISQKIKNKPTYKAGQNLKKNIHIPSEECINSGFPK